MTDKRPRAAFEAFEASINFDAIKEGTADAVWEQIALTRDVSFFCAIESGAEDAIAKWLTENRTEIVDAIANKFCRADQAARPTTTPTRPLIATAPMATGRTAAGETLYAIPCPACQTDNSFSVFDADGRCPCGESLP